MDPDRVCRRRDLVAKRLLAEHLRQLGKKLQMLLGRLLRHQQDEHLIDRLAVGRVERDRLQRPNECSERARKALDASVRDGDALTQTRRSEPLAREQAVEDDRARDLRVVLEHLADLLEQTLFARGFDVERDIRLGQEIRDVGHRWCERNAAANGKCTIVAHGWAIAPRPTSGTRGEQHYTLAQACLARRGRFRIVLDRRRLVPVAVALFLMTQYLPVELVGERVDGRVHVFLDAFGMNLLAADVKVGADLLSELVDRKHDVYIDHMVEMACNSLELGGNVFPDGGGDQKVMAGEV